MRFLGVDFNVTDIKGFDLSTEYAINRRFQRFPNQNFRKLPAIEQTSEAFYMTASYVRYPFFGYGETFYLDPDYSTAAYMADGFWQHQLRPALPPPLRVRR